MRIDHTLFRKCLPLPRFPTQTTLFRELTGALARAHNSIIHRLLCRIGLWISIFSNEILETYIVASNLAIESHIERCKTLVKASHVLPALIYATGKNNVDAYEYVRNKNNN